MESERLEFLLNRYFDQALLPEEKAEFEQTLLSSADARELFWERSQWNSTIRQWAEEEAGRIEAVIEPLPEQPVQPVLRTASVPAPRRPAAGGSIPRIASRRHSAAWPIALAAAVVLGFLGWMQWGPKSRPKNTAFAKITRLETAIWEDGSSHPSGESLKGAILKLKSGVVQLDFSRGAKVLVEGPATFEILSDNSAALREGKLHATVPPSAHGFKIEAPGFVAMDYGTQFGCAVTPARAPEVHVFQGSVGVAAPQSKEVMLDPHHAVRFSDGQWDDIPVRPDEFVNEATLSGYREAREQLEQWQRDHHEFSNHPGMLAHFDFETSEAENDRTLINRAPQAASETHGIITGCRWTGGRWPGKRALEFSSPDDRVRLNLPGEYPAMTFLASVRVANTSLRLNSLIRSNEEERIGEIHWYVTGKEELGWSARIAPRGAANQLRHVFSLPVIQGEAVESWIQLATVFDGTKVTHFLNGRPMGTSVDEQPKFLHLGQLDIGNGSTVRTPRSEREAAANFSGAIDELAILSVPLSAEEIRELYGRNHPQK